MKNLYEYKGNTPVKTGDKVEILDPEGEYPSFNAKVMCSLATQFAWRTKETQGYCFYSDKGVTWRML